MAEITWQNVNAPSNADVFRGMALAAAGLDTATNTFKAAGDTFAKVNQSAMDQSDAAKLLQAKAALAQAKTMGDYDAVIAAQTPSLMTYNNPDTASKFFTDAPSTIANQLSNRAAGVTSGTSAQVGEIQAPEKIDRAQTGADAYTGAASLIHEGAIKKAMTDAKYGLSDANSKEAALPTAIAANDINNFNTAESAFHTGLLTQESLFPSFQTQLLNQDTQQAKDLATAQQLNAEIPTIEETARTNAQTQVIGDRTASKVGALDNSPEEQESTVKAAEQAREVSKKVAAFDAQTKLSTAAFDAKTADHLISDDDIKRNEEFSTRIKGTDSEIETKKASRINMEGLIKIIPGLPNASPEEQQGVTTGIAAALSMLQKQGYGNEVNLIPHETAVRLVTELYPRAGVGPWTSDMSVELAGELETSLLSQDGKNERNEYRMQLSQLENKKLLDMQQQMYHQQKSVYMSEVRQNAAKMAEDAKKKAEVDQTIHRNNLQQSQDEAEAIQKQNLKEALYLNGADPQALPATKPQALPTTKKVASIRGLPPKIVPLSPDDIKAAEIARNKALMKAQEQAQYDKNQAEYDAWMKAHNK